MRGIFAMNAPHLVSFLYFTLTSIVVAEVRALPLKDKAEETVIFA